MSDAHDELARFIARVRRRWVACVLLRAVGRGALACALPVAVAYVVFRVVHPRGGVTHE